MPRSHSIVFTFGSIGNGQVVPASVTPPEEHFAPGQSAVLGPASTRAFNLRLYAGLAQTRRGYKAFADTPATFPVNGLFQALYDNGQVDVLRFDRTKIRRLVSGSWTDITGSLALTGGDLDTWALAMVRRAGTGSTRNQLVGCNGVNALFRLSAGDATVTAFGTSVITGARVIIPHAARALYCNVLDSSSIRRHQRVHFSVVGDPTDLSGTGSGFDDLTDDPYPIAAGVLLGGRPVLYKGNNVGGSVVVGTPTGVLGTPYRWDHVNVSQQGGVGILLPRTLLVLSESLSFFVGHDGVYLHDGGRGFRRVAEAFSRDAIPRVNMGALAGGLAWHDRETGEIYIGVPTGTSQFPNEWWIYNFREDRLYGPIAYSDTVSAVATTASTGVLTWDTLTGPTWDSMPYSSWDTIGSSPSAQSILFGSTTGKTFEDDRVQTSDAGEEISSEYRTAAIVANGQQIRLPDGTIRVLDTHDVLTLREVTLRYKDGLPWTPLVEISNDGGNTWTSVGDGLPIAGGNTGRILTKTYYTAISAPWFMARVIGSRMQLHSIALEMTYAGDVRHE